MKILLLSAFIFLLGLDLFAQGSEMIKDGGFSSGTTFWSVTGAWTISSDTARNSGGNWGNLTQTDANLASPMKANTTYTIEFDIVTNGLARFRLNSNDAGTYYIYSANSSYANGHHKFEFTTPVTIGNGGLQFFGWDSSSEFKLDNVSLKENAAIGNSPYYVSTTGNDLNSGAIDSPWATWEKAAKNAFAGDTVYFRGGIYNLKKSISLNGSRGEINSGEYRKPVCFFGYPEDIELGDSVIFDFSGNYIEEPDYDYWDSVYIAGGSFVGTQNYGLSLNWVDYIHVKDFTVRNVYQKYRYVLGHGLMLSGSTNIIAEKLHIYNIGGEGLYYDPNYKVDTTYFVNIDLHNCIDSLSANPANYFMSQAGSRSHGFFIIANVTDSAKGIHSYLTIEGCRAWKCGDDGFNVVVLGEVVMKNNWSFWNGAYLPIYENAYTSGNGYKLNAQAGANNDRASHSIDQYKVYNNIAAFNQGYGFSDNCSSTHPRKNRKMYNNISYKNDGTGFVIKEGSSLYGYWYEDFINNISYGHDYNLNFGGESYMTINKFNSWNDPPGIFVSDADFTSSDPLTIINSLKAPRKSDGSLPDLISFKLSSSSRLIDAGIDIGLSYNGNAPDLGALEYDMVPGTSNKYPSVIITSPKDGRIFMKPNDNITISADAADTDGSIYSIEFFINDTVKIDEIFTAPWSINWDHAPVGKFSLRAVATDNEGAKSTSARIWVSILPGSFNSEMENSGFIYPNPNNGSFTFFVTEPLQSNSELIITSIDGSVVFEDTIIQEQVTKQFDLSFLKPGIYIITLSSNKILLTSKFIKI